MSGARSTPPDVAHGAMMRAGVPLADVQARYRPGFVLTPFDRHVTQTMIDEYAQATGDFNPIHVDPDYARSGPFGRTIAHGLMTLTFVAQMLNDWSGGAFDACGALDVAFVGPVFAGETVEITAQVEAIEPRDDGPVARCVLNCRAGDRTILVGTVHQPVTPATKG